MRQPLRAKGSPRQQVSISQSYPAPLGGWNARDALAAMPITDAITLENWFPKTNYLEIRGGTTDHLTGINGTPKTLAVYNAMGGTSKMFAITATGVFDASTAGAVGASLATVTNAKWQFVNFGDGTNNWLIAVNGVDKPLYYDGTTWTAVDTATSPALTGLTSTSIAHVGIHKGRLIFIQKDSLSFWYLAAGAAGGALTEFDLSGEASLGGYLMAFAAWTFDGGTGLDDYAVFVTSKGEVIIYQGTNPSSSTTWAKVGTYRLSEPLGRRCFVQYGGDVVLLTQEGAFPLAQSLKSVTIDNRPALSDKIKNAFNDAARLYGDTFGWEAINYPAQSAMLFNIPIMEDGEHEQYVFNTITKAWCKFKEWDAETFAVYNQELYFATSTKVVKAWTGASDGGSNIIAYGKQAFSYFGQRGKEKRLTLFRPVLAVNGSVSFLVGVDTDFRDRPISGVATYTAVSTGIWNQSTWNNANWAGGMEIVQNWTSPSANVGYCFAGKIKIATDTLTVQWMSSDYVYEPGGIL